VHDAAGETDRARTGGRALLVLDVSGGERSSESGMQHLSLLLAYVDSSLNAER
jgi:hypothetical protein